MQCADSVGRQQLASCADETLPSPVSSAPVSAEYERALITMRLRELEIANEKLEESNADLRERILAIELRHSSKPPEFEVKGPNGWTIRGKQVVGVAMAFTSAGVAIAYLLLRK